MRLVRRIYNLLSLAAAASLLALWMYAGSYGLHTLLRHGGTYWIPVNADSERLSPSMRLAFAKAPAAAPGTFEWKTIAPGFDVGELPALAEGHEVDRVLLARIDPSDYRFAVLNGPAGDKNLDQWMDALGAALVVNGSYYSRYGLPDTPFLSDGKLLGPANYDAKAGAFVDSSIRDLSRQDWKKAFYGAKNAMVSYPMLIQEGAAHVTSPSRWLANRSFVGQDKQGRIIIGTTKDAFFSLDRFAVFLQASPLDLTLALNLDGGPVASQGIALNGFERRTYGRWEAQVEGKDVQLLTWPYGTVAMPVVLAVFPMPHP